MKLSQIKSSDVVAYLNIDEDEYEEGELEKEMVPIMAAAKSYILNYTGLRIEQADEKEEFYIAFMVLCQDMRENRTLYVDKNNVNKVVENILGMHCVNLL